MVVEWVLVDWEEGCIVEAVESHNILGVAEHIVEEEGDIVVAVEEEHIADPEGIVVV
jgi:hypothetical protein